MPYGTTKTAGDEENDTIGSAPGWWRTTFHYLFYYPLCCCCCRGFDPFGVEAYYSQFNNQMNGGVKPDEKSALLASSSSFYAPTPPSRAFVLARHGHHGFLLLKAFKKSKGVHYQLPGGRIDSTDSSPQYAAAREFMEETGIDLRDQLERFRGVVFPDGSSSLRGRLYFLLDLNDSDSLRHDAVDPRTGAKPHGSETGEHYYLHLSHEHLGFRFEKNIAAAAELVAL